MTNVFFSRCLKPLMKHDDRVFDTEEKVQKRKKKNNNKHLFLLRNRKYENRAAADER